MDDWKQTMEAIEAWAEANCAEWFEVRGAVIDARVAEDPQAWEGHGIGSSDGNHMLYGAWKSGELPAICHHLVERGELIKRCAGDRDWRQVRGELRELFAPAVDA